MQNYLRLHSRGNESAAAAEAQHSTLVTLLAASETARLQVQNIAKCIEALRLPLCTAHVTHIFGCTHEKCAYQ